MWERQNARAAAAATKEAEGKSKETGNVAQTNGDPEAKIDDSEQSEGSKLEVPDRIDGAASPEPVFVEAKEQPQTSGTE